jgi:hypothetical protein
MHLNTGALVDIAEGTQLEASAPHLADCESCRARLRDLRAMMSAARNVDVPEPSPLFWDHLSSRVSQAVAADGAGDGSARLKGSRSVVDVLHSLFGARAFQASVVAAAAGVLLAIALSSRAPLRVPGAPPAAPSVADANAAIDPLSELAPDDDVSLTLVASLTDDADLETVREAGLAPRGSAEHAVTHMNDGELRELGRLLKAELKRPGA